VLRTARGEIVFERGYWGENSFEPGRPSCDMVVNGVPVTVMVDKEAKDADAWIKFPEEPAHEMQLQPIMHMSVRIDADVAEFRRILWSLRPERQATKNEIVWPIPRSR